MGGTQSAAVDPGFEEDYPSVLASLSYDDCCDLLLFPSKASDNSAAEKILPRNYGRLHLLFFWMLLQPISTYFIKRFAKKLGNETMIVCWFEFMSVYESKNPSSVKNEVTVKLYLMYTDSGSKILSEGVKALLLSSCTGKVGDDVSETVPLSSHYEEAGEIKLLVCVLKTMFMVTFEEIFVPLISMTPPGCWCGGLLQRRSDQ